MLSSKYDSMFKIFERYAVMNVPVEIKTIHYSTWQNVFEKYLVIIFSSLLSKNKFLISISKKAGWSSSNFSGITSKIHMTIYLMNQNTKQDKRSL